jgi:anti-sigma28 factor (negative regulator of flagellin synthesis)
LDVGTGIQRFIGRVKGFAMSISPIGSSTPITRLHGSTAVGFSQGSQDVSRDVSDTVEISETARYLGELKKLPDVRQDKVQAARDAIAAGNFESSERLEGTIDALLKEFS